MIALEEINSAPFNYNAPVLTKNEAEELTGSGLVIRNAIHKIYVAYQDFTDFKMGSMGNRYTPHDQDMYHHNYKNNLSSADHLEVIQKNAQRLGNLSLAYIIKSPLSKRSMCSWADAAFSYSTSEERIEEAIKDTNRVYKSTIEMSGSQFVRDTLQITQEKVLSKVPDISAFHDQFLSSYDIFQKEKTMRSEEWEAFKKSMRTFRQ